MKAKQLEKIRNHGEDLNRIFNTGLDPVELCKKLRRLENKAHELSTKWCNGIIEQPEWDLLTNQVLYKVYKILNLVGEIEQSLIFINGDVRGYALKIDDDFIKRNDVEIHRDMGGYGIIAPEIK